MASGDKKKYHKDFVRLGELSDEPPPKWSVPDKVEWKVIDEDISISGYIEFYALHERRKLGYAYLEMRDDHVLWLDMIFVFPPARGQGLGAKILRRVEEYFRAKDVREIQGEVILCDYTPSLKVCEERAEWFRECGFTCQRRAGGGWSIAKKLK
jgi:GNAT superfamily N-acetyltransferase